LADQTRFDDLVTLLLDEYRANERKSLAAKLSMSESCP
jgi:hypothetical protein